MTDETAVKSRSSDEQIRETVRKERSRLFSFIRKRISTDEEAEDIVQDVFYELVESYRLMKPIEQLASWLFAVARNKITDRHRKKRTDSLEDSFSTAEADDEGYLFLAEILPSGELSAEDRIFLDTTMELVMAALDELPANQKEAFILHELEGRSLQDIADETGVPLKTVISRKRYAVLHLREELRDFYNEWLNK